MIKFSNNKELNALATSFVREYRALKPSSLSLNAYNQKYLERYLTKLEYNTYIAASIAQHFWQYKNSSLIDFGGGIGFNAAFFKYVGFDSIILVDHDALCIQDAQKIHATLGLKVAGYVSGGLDYLKRINLNNTIVASRDVIEHVYNLKEFFQITSSAFLNAHNTAAIHNSFFRKQEFERIHHKAENIGFNEEGLKAMDSSLAYSQLRRNFIRSNYPDLENIDTAVLDTRGLNYNDIERFLTQKHYDKLAKQLLYSNTCNPETGNWAERTLPFEAYKMFAKEAGVTSLQFELLNYNTYNQGLIKKMGLKVLNKIVQTTQDPRVAPSFTITY
jgi:protein-L-isoaspartate O-methyltransferase